MRKKIVPLIAIAFVVAVLSTAVFYSLFASRLSGAAPAAPTNPVPKADAVTKANAEAGVPAGMRAVSVHISDSSGVVGMLKPGAKVDVQVFGWRSAKGPRDEMKTLLRAVPVLAVSPLPESSSQGYFSAPVVTLVARAHDAEELALADSYARLRLTLRNSLDPAAESAVSLPETNRIQPKPAPAQANRRVPGARLRIRAMSFNDAGLLELTGRMDQRIGPKGIGIVALTRPDTLAGLVGKADQVRQEAESVVVVASFRQSSWFDLPKACQDAYGRVRVKFVLLEDGKGIRLRPEVTGMWSGHTETHSVETEWRTEPGRPIVISGLDAGDERPNAASRHLVLVVEPDPKPTV